MSNHPISISKILLGYNPLNPLLPAFSVNAPKGELIALIGRNGIGKSTLIRTIIGEQMPLSGTVCLNGVPLKRWSRRQRAKLIAYVPSEQVRIPNLFIRDFVALARFPYLGWPKSLSSNDWDMVDQSLMLVGIDHLANRDISTVSDGERQRAMIAFALAQNSDIILLDEPTAFLDLPNKYEVVRLLSNLARSHQKTIIYSTHDLQGAISEVDTLWMMLDSGFVFGAPEDIAFSNKFGKLLEKSELSFDTKTGLFNNQREHTKPIALEGQGNLLFWTQRLVERLGFVSTEQVKSEYSISCKPLSSGNCWEVYQHGALISKVNTLTELGVLLRKL